jgi:type II secretory pathway predicted ATPase ExeA
MKFFNTAGPNQPDIHYTLDPLSRWNLDELLTLIDARKYFILHAPRQTGKTSCMLALMKYLNQGEKYRALYVNIEAAQAAREDVFKAVQGILSRTTECEKNYWKTNHLEKERQAILNNGEMDAITGAFSLLAKKSERPVVLFIDEIDALIGDTLISVLRQIRSGYTDRPEAFPQSIILCGVRDVRDYRIHSSRTKEIITGGSAFNIKAESLRLGNFTREDIHSLYWEHTKETGQIFEEGILDLAWNYSGGQPWLVNALAFEACFRTKESKDRTKPITVEMFKDAKESLILRRDTHLDQLSDKLKEERVRSIIEPILKGGDTLSQFNDNDLMYLIDLGLVNKLTGGKVEIANEIYREIIPRELVWTTQATIHHETVWYVDKVSNKIDFRKLLTAFQEFFQENSEIWIDQFAYREAGPQLLLQAFLQRIVNGGGIINREYGLGTKRTDLYIKWYHDEKDRSLSQKVVIECKLLHKTLEKTIQEGLEQLTLYADKCSAEESHLMIFDRTKEKPWEEKVFVREMEYRYRKIMIWGM